MTEKTSTLTKKNFDDKWLSDLASDDETKDKIQKIIDWNQAVTDGRFQESNDLLDLKLGDHHVWLRESEAWFAVHLYEHIFKDKEHLDFEGFDGKGAKTVIDLGANIGFYTLAIKDNNPDCRVIAVEPNPAAFELLEKNISANSLKEVEPLNIAISEDASDLTIRVLKEGSAYGGKYLGDIKKEYRQWIDEKRIQTIKVKTSSLADLLAKYDIDQVDILKMDVEGMELEILRGAQPVLDKISRVVFEWHDHDSKDEAVKLLEANGFQLIHDDKREYGNLYFAR